MGRGGGGGHPKEQKSLWEESKKRPVSGTSAQKPMRAGVNCEKTDNGKWRKRIVRHTWDQPELGDV